MPGPDFVEGFMKRHSSLTIRTANLIKRGWAELSHKIVNKFFNHFKQTAAAIPPENIFNFDKTNLSDIPGAKKAVFSKGVKHAEQIRDHRKYAISNMFCGSATGQLNPHYVVYKAGNLYPSWCKGGPKGTRFIISTSGWFDAPIFRD